MHVISTDQHREFDDLTLAEMALQFFLDRVRNLDVQRHGVRIGERGALRRAEKFMVFPVLDGGDLLRAQTFLGRVDGAVGLAHMADAIEYADAYDDHLTHRPVQLGLAAHRGDLI